MNKPIFPIDRCKERKCAEKLRPNQLNIDCFTDSLRFLDRKSQNVIKKVTETIDKTNLLIWSVRRTYALIKIKFICHWALLKFSA